MKLYYYSSKSNTHVEVKWTIAKIVTGGILVGTIMFFGLIRLNQSGEKSTDTLAVENIILQQQLSSMAPRVRALEVQVGQLRERGNQIQMLFERRKSIGTMHAGFMISPKELESAEAEIGLAATKSQFEPDYVNQLKTSTAIWFMLGDNGRTSSPTYEALSQTEERKAVDDTAKSRKSE